MTVETASTINQLNEFLPAGTDPKSEGDQHIRLMKKALKTTFPAVTGAVTLTHQAINLLPAALTTLDGKTVQYVGSGAYPSKVIDAKGYRIANVASWDGNALRQGDAAQNKWVVDHTLARMTTQTHRTGTVLITTDTANPNSWLGYGSWSLERSEAVGQFPSYWWVRIS